MLNETSLEIKNIDFFMQNVLSGPKTTEKCQYSNFDMFALIFIQLIISVTCVTRRGHTFQTD